MYTRGGVGERSSSSRPKNRVGGRRPRLTPAGFGPSLLGAVPFPAPPSTSRPTPEDAPGGTDPPRTTRPSVDPRRRVRAHERCPCRGVSCRHVGHAFSRLGPRKESAAGEVPAGPRRYDIGRRHLNYRNLSQGITAVGPCIGRLVLRSALVDERPIFGHCVSVRPVYAAIPIRCQGHTTFPPRGAVTFHHGTAETGAASPHLPFDNSPVMHWTSMRKVTGASLNQATSAPRPRGPRRGCPTRCI